MPLATLIAAPLQQTQGPSLQWEYLWLAVGGLLLILATLAFIYLIAERQWGWVRRIAQSPPLRRVDEFLADHVPGLWSFIRRRFSIGEWRGLALTATTVVVFAASYVFALIAEGWMEEDVLYALDQRVYNWLMDAANADIVSFMEIITRFADSITVTVVAVIVGVVLLAYRKRWEVVSLLLTVGVGSGVMQGLKWFFERTRPTEQVIQAAGHSFPSGHAFLATALYGWFIYVTWKFVRQDAARIAATIVLTLLIFLVGISRIILRVHWTSDVAGGFTVGLAWLVCSILLTRILRTNFSNRHHEVPNPGAS